MQDFKNDRIWAEVSLNDLKFNYNQVKKIVGESVQLLPVIKADAYGHGDVQAAKALLDADAKRFAVATPDEALTLRNSGITVPILVLGIVPFERVNELADADISLCVANKEIADAYESQLNGKKLSIHLKFDTGMTRLGMSSQNIESAIDEGFSIASKKCFDLCGAFTHFAASGNHSQDEYTKNQYESFLLIIDGLRKKGVNIPLVHCANSDAIMNQPYTYLDMVRPGIMLYGYGEVPENLTLKPVMSWRARIAHVQWVEEGMTVSYERTWTAPKKTCIATITCGYADGLIRTASNKLSMLVHGKRANQIGRICMDMCMLDITDIPNVKVGDIATIIGKDGNEIITADEVANAAGTISYEVLCALSKRVPRYYI